MICTKAKVKSTGEIVLLREPFHDEFTCSLCEPDYIQIDDNGNTIYDNAKNVIGYANDELILLDYHYDTTQPVDVKEYVDKDIIKNILCFQQSNSLIWQLLRLNLHCPKGSHKIQRIAAPLFRRK